jgi:hypothetical protein
LYRLAYAFVDRCSTVMQAGKSRGDLQARLGRGRTSALPMGRLDCRTRLSSKGLIDAISLVHAIVE